MNVVVDLRFWVELKNNVHERSLHACRTVILLVSVRIIVSGFTYVTSHNYVQWLSSAEAIHSNCVDYNLQLIIKYSALKIVIVRVRL